jgi:holin-like protein
MGRADRSAAVKMPDAVSEGRGKDLTIRKCERKMGKDYSHGKVVSVLKVLLQIGAIFGIYWLSQGIEKILPFPFPASVISLIVLLVLLSVKAVKLNQIHEMTDFILGNLAFFFVPVTMKIVDYADVVLEHGAAFLTICVVSTILTFGATAWTVQLTNRWMNRKKEGVK